jgi:SpoVK/Ycf46/Vps4 family AAA+-type ATPase
MVIDGSYCVTPLGDRNMARADLMKKLFQSYQKRDDQNFRAVAEELISEERKKQHVVLANELELILKNGFTESSNNFMPLAFYETTPPQDKDRHTNLLEIKSPRRYLDDIILNPTTRNMVEQIMLEFREWEVLQTNGLSPVRRVLFCGPSGCGKTATAEALASELGLPLLYVRFDAVVSSLLGETAANLRKVFDFARRGQWVMLFDEFDTIGRSRDDATEHGEIKRVINSFLQIMDNFEGRSLIIAATNFEQVLDPAVWRRFDDVVRFEKPGVSHLEALIQKRLKPLVFDDAIVKSLTEVLLGCSYADAERVCLGIRKISILHGSGKPRRVQAKDLQEALKRYEYRRLLLDRIPTTTTPIIDKE